MKVLLGVIVALTIVGVAGVILKWTQQRPRPVLVELASVDTGTIQGSVASMRAGTIKSCRHAQLAPAVGGQLGRLFVQRGQKVNAGDLLFELRVEDLEEQLELTLAENEASRVEVDQACAAAQAAERRGRRLSRLRRSRVDSVAGEDRVMRDSERWQLACTAAVAALEVNDARMRVAQSNIERSRVRAPFAGVVAGVHSQPGDYVAWTATSNERGVVEIFDADCLYLSAALDADATAAVSIGMRACVILENLPDERRCSGIVRRLVSREESDVKSAATEMEVEFQDAAESRGLLPGQRAHVEIAPPARESVVRVPTAAIRNGNEVLVYDENDQRLHRREIEAGISDGEHTEVVAGLQLGERVALHVANSAIRDGTYVVPQK